MPVPPLAEFWELLARSGLVDAGAAETLRKEHAADPAGCGGDDSKEVARWLAGRGVITRWQAKRLGIGNLGPFFFGDYRLLERHDGAGDELLFTARHDPSGRIVSLVLLDSKWCKRLDAWTEIVRRTTAANAATDPMLSRTWSLEQHEGKRFIICEHVVGTNLADELERRGPLPAIQAGVLVSQLARAVADLHAGGTVHGSLSLDALRREPPPGGVERTGRVRLLQFPLAGDPHRTPVRPWRSEQEIPALGRRAAYVAPELTLANAVCDARSDVYSIGAILYALLSGTHPCWEGDAEGTLKRAALGGGPRPLEPPDVSPEMATLVGYLMARDPADRYQTAIEAAEAIAACLGLAGTAPAAVARSAAPASAGSPWPPSGEPASGVDEAGELPDFTFAVTAPMTARPAATQPAGSQRNGTQPSVPQPAGETATARLMRRRAARLRLIGGAVTLALVATVVGLVVNRIDFDSPAPPPIRPPQVGRQEPPSQPPADERPILSGPFELPGAAGAGRPTGPVPRQIQTVVEDATLPWKSPTEGSRPRLAYLPPGTELGLLARPGDLAADDEGRLFLKALGPVVEGALAKLASFCGCEVAEIETVQAGWQAGEGDAVLGGYAVRLVKGRTLPADEAARRQAWGPTSPRDVAEETVHVGKPFSFWVPAAEQGRVLVVASDAQIETDIPAAPGAGAVREPFIAAIVKQSLAARDRPATAVLADLPLQLESLVGMLDADRHVTLFGSPHYLLNRGRGVLAGPLAKLAKPLENLFGESAKAAAVSAHFGANTYFELDVVAERDLPARALAPQLAGRVEALAPAVEEYCALLNPSPYGRVLVMRLPGMLRTVVANMRAGPEGNAVVLNAYLPRHAGHNLALAAELALAQTPGAPVSTVAAAAPKSPGTPTSTLDKLRKKITIVFARDTLEMAIQMVSDEVGVPMEIVGTDLQLDGITQNQSFALEQRDQPAAAVLGVILKQANPAGKLVYVVRQEAGGEKIYITTRAQAEKRKEPLPPEFQAGADPKNEEKT